MKKIIACLYLFLFCHWVWATDPNIGETPEIQYSQANAPDLYAQSQQLATPINIYQYLRNNTEYALYHGSVSGSINTYGGMRGNDVDLASTLIAMLRARGTPARYVVGTATVGASQLMNWLGVQDLTLAAALLNDQGVQGVTINGGNTSVSFEHVWVEALVYYDNYRGGSASTVSCVATPAACHWVPLDPSFKLKTYGSQNIDLHDTVQFDYTSYYNAILNNDTTRMNKNPLEIFEEQVAAWLRGNMPGKTLEDVANVGVIQPDESGLLPASLPYAITGTPRRYNSAKDHDDAVVAGTEPKKWVKTLSLTLTNYDYAAGVEHTVNIPAISLVDISTKRLTVSYNASLQELEISLGGVIQYSISSGNSQLGQAITVDTLYDLSLSMDGPPSTVQGTADQPLTALYQNLKFGGYYLVVTGGETSNWSQVHQAAQQLLASDQQYKIVFNPADPGLNGQACVPASGLNCTPYLDTGSGWTGSNTKLSDNPTAMEALTGQLLYVAGTQYFVKQREQLDRLDHLNHTKTPISGFMGVVSSVGTPEYIAGTAFSILPGGLLIDMKGDYFAGSWRIGKPVTTAASNKVFELGGHVSSSLEHEVWQELTGYDAVSTVRGIQMALASGATLLNPKKATLPAFYTALGFSSTVPSGFTYAPITLFSTQPALWTSSTDPSYFDLLKSDINYSTSLLRRYQATYTYASNSGLYPWVSCVASQQQSLSSLISSGYGNYPITLFTSGGAPLSFCDGSPHTGTVSNVLSQLQTFYQNTVIPTYIGEPYFDIFDQAKGFLLTDYVYRRYPPALDAIDASTVQIIRDTVSIPINPQGNPNGHNPEFLIPSRQAVGSTYRFSVYVFNDYDAQGSLAQTGYFIFNNSVVAGGGYVDGKKPLNPATSIPGTSVTAPTFNNATLTDKNTIAEANNNTVKTPSTIDPVSTVTGNNYHDETDFVIKGRAGLNYAFTRTYNSAPSATQTDLGLGFGWVHSYGMRLKSNDYGVCPNCTSAQALENGNSKTSSITFTDERGGDHNYLVTEDSSHQVTPPQGEFDSLALDTPTAGQNTLTFRNGTRYLFENVSADEKSLAPGSTLKTTPGIKSRLKQIADPWGNQLNFTYNANGRLATVTDNLGISGRTGLAFTYDASNHLQSISDWSGRTWGYSVNANNNLASTTNPLSQTRSYGYGSGSALHNLLTVAKPLQRNGITVQTTFSYYQNGRTFNYHDALGNTETLDYDLYRKSTRVTDPRGGIREYEYDSAGRMTKLREPDGAILFFENQGDGLRYTKTDGLGYKTQYSYKSDFSFNTTSNTFGNVTREQDALNQRVDTTYGIYDQVATVKDKRSTTVTTSFHTGSGACIAPGKPKDVTISTLGGTPNVKLKSYCWNADGSLSSQTDYLSPTDISKTRITSYTYETAAHLNVQSITVTGWDGTSVSKSYTYDPLGRQQTETLNRRTSPSNAAPLALVTTTIWDALDRAVQIQDPIGNLFINRFDANGQLLQVTHQYKLAGGGYDTRNVVTRAFDGADQVSTETDALGGVTTYGYDGAGNVVSVTDPENHTLQYEYDAMNRRISVTDANGRSVKTTYDLAGHPVAVTNGANETVSTVFDQIGRPTTVTDPHGYVSTQSFDANNNVICAIDANAQVGLQAKNSDGCTVSTIYDELNRPTLVRDALNGVTQLAYDLLGNPVTRIDAEGRKYTWAYDGLGRLTSETDFAGNATIYVLDQAGNPWQKTNRLSEVTQTTFDGLNRPTQVSYLKDGSSEAFSYDPAGNLATAANGNVSYALQYDPLNRLQSKLDSRGRSLNFTWDKSGHILTKTTYQGSMTSYTYDGAGTLVSLFNPDYLTVNYQYDNAGRLVSRVMSSGARSLYGYDSGGWLQSLSHTDAVGATVTSQTYNRDRIGNIVTLSVTAGPATGTTTYTLDALYRLTAVDAPGTANDEAFSYDHLGNRLIATRGSATVGASGSGITSKYYLYTAATRTGTVSGYTPTYANRLSQIRIGSVGGTIDSSFTFDNEGRLTAQTGSTPRSLTWDAKGRLKTLNGETYAYDPSNYRIGRSGGSLGTLDYYLEGEHLESVESDGTLTDKYFRGSTIDELVAGYTTQGGKLTPFMFQHDQVMSVAAETIPNGGTQASLAYSAFGESLATTGTPISRLQYTGRENEGNGLYHYRARYYDPRIGQFISEDPKRFAAGQNFYAYCGNSPLGCSDPSGLGGSAAHTPIPTDWSKVGRSLIDIGSNAFGVVIGSALISTGVATTEIGGAGVPIAILGGTVTTKSVVGLNLGIQNLGDALVSRSSDRPSSLAEMTSEYIAPGNSLIKASLQTFDMGLDFSTGRITPTKLVVLSDGIPGLTMADKVLMNIGVGSNTFQKANDAFQGMSSAGSIYDSSSSIFNSINPAISPVPTTSFQFPPAGASFNDLSSENWADGGFLLYPNKPNSNQMRSIYAK